MVRQRSSDDARTRSKRFNDTTGALTWNYRSASLHPDRCECQAPETTPHKHYDEAPYACAFITEDARAVALEAYRRRVPS